MKPHPLIPSPQERGLYIKQRLTNMSTNKQINLSFSRLSNGAPPLRGGREGLIIFLFSVVFSFTTYAQNVEFTKENFANNKDGFKDAKNRLETGDKLFEQGPMFYKLAVYHYYAANQFNPNNATLNLKIGKCLLYSS